MKRIFISDLHLADGLTGITEGFQHFLAENCADIDELYILGDFFEVWLGDDDLSDYNQLISDLLAALHCQVFLMHGNRDFLLGGDFCRRSNATLLPDPTVISLGDEPVLLMHGDSLCTKDVAYMQARTLLRSADFQADFLAKPLAERAEIARQLRGESKAHTRETADDIMDVTPEEVTRVMSDAGVRILIHGHTHRPDMHQLDNGATRYVLGDWHTSTRYLAEVDGDLSLLKFDF